MHFYLSFLIKCNDVKTMGSLHPFCYGSLCTKYIFRFQTRMNWDSIISLLFNNLLLDTISGNIIKILNAIHLISFSVIFYIAFRFTYSSLVMHLNCNIIFLNVITLNVLVNLGYLCIPKFYHFGEYFYIQKYMKTNSEKFNPKSFKHVI